MLAMVPGRPQQSAWTHRGAIREQETSRPAGNCWLAVTEGPLMHQGGNGVTKLKNSTGMFTSGFFTWVLTWPLLTPSA